MIRGNTLGIAPCLEGLAGVALARGHHDRAGRLLAAADALREAIGTPRWPVDQAGYARDLAAVRTALGEDSFTAAWTAGRAMAWQDAAALALVDPLSNS